MDTDETQIFMSKQLTEEQKTNRKWVAQIRRFESDREQIQFKMEAHLRERGWEHTSQTPGCYWRWVKKLPDGRTVMCDFGAAITIETHTMDFGHLDTDAE